ncbi:uncharacterized protein SPAPADRAFT_60251 [Spathaspora passalidarum NRRL Y-27907]|uniref:Metallo-beta-lactamase domain-containing protein n=1 Tax=Spathaspora passalidarum (strain NRRL Y-27907 / 11-Y1) TaxID=619300 RepID=G3AKF2_SPAPN|nr:uncharacterized protein SPAPADRAFT_60251 [Spathaspora passalidarum NRRL Y-27907]EGW32909.1 hypothetical protein SPAPADRAFT_60251 [Spathaspora passalidarum NRRL Y-27907]
MGYPDNFKIVTKQLSDNLLLASTSFTRVNKFNFGARMAVFKTNQDLIVWSPLPYNDQVVSTLKEFSGDKFNITHVIVPDREHNLAAKSYKDKFPTAKIIAMENITSFKPDYLFTKANGNKVLKGEELKQIVKDDVIVEKFEFVYLPFHENQELVLFDKQTKTVFEADLLFNLGEPGTTSGKVVLEQFSPELGFKPGFNPHGGWSFPTRYLQPYSKVGRFLFRKIVNPAKSAPGLNAIYSWDFNTIVMCHGNIITKGAKDAFKHVFL